MKKVLLFILSFVMIVTASVVPSIASAPSAIIADDVTVTAKVEKIVGNQNRLRITITDSGGVKNQDFMINNNAAEVYPVSTETGDYEIYVDTKGNTQIRACYIVSFEPFLCDYTGLDTALIAVSELDEALYTEESWAKLVEAVEAANAVDRNLAVSSQGIIDSLTNNIYEAMEELVMKQEEVWKKRYEAEDAVFSANNNTSEQNYVASYSGTGYVGQFTSSSNPVSFVTFTVTAPEEGIYDLFVAGLGNGGAKPVKIAVNDIPQGDIEIVGSNVSNTPVESKIQLRLNEGENTIVITPGWTWFIIDYIRIDYPEEDLLEIAMNFDRELCNPNANADAKQLWSFLVENYGTKVISGQVSNKLSDPEMPEIKAITGSYPAIMGFDFMDYSTSRYEWRYPDLPEAVDHAIEWVTEESGIVTFHWHWNAPSKYLIDQGQSNVPNGQRWWSGFYIDAVNKNLFDLKKIMNGEDDEGLELLINDIDAIAEQLLRLQELGVPVIWRPLHEASGGWFWWGAYGPEACKKLYILMYDRLTNYHGLNNLIWVWNSEGEDWFPGEEYVDIVSCDVGASKGEYLSYQTQYYKMVQELNDLGTMKMLALSETGPIPDIDSMIRDRAMWSYWVTWVGMDNVNKTSSEQLQKMYNSPLVYSLNKLPPLYSINPGDNEETIVWEGYKRAPAWSWNELQMAAWGGELGVYDPGMIKPGHLINVTFKSNSVPTLTIGGNPDLEVSASQVSGSVDGYRVASFSCDEILSAYADISTDTWALLVRSGSVIELVKIAVVNSAP